MRSAVEMAKEGLISKQEALARVKTSSISEILSLQFDFSRGIPKALFQGLAASPGAAVGRVALSADEAVEMGGNHTSSIGGHGPPTPLDVA